MSESIFGRKKAAASSFSNPSLVSSNTPTLANPTGGFGLPINNAPLKTVTEVSTDSQEAQSADEQLLEPEAIQKKPLSHDISRISLRRPQAKLTIEEPGNEADKSPVHELTHVVRQTGAKTLQHRAAITPKYHDEELETKISLAAEDVTIQPKQDSTSPESDPKFPAVTDGTPEKAVTPPPVTPATPPADIGVGASQANSKPSMPGGSQSNQPIPTTPAPSPLPPSTVDNNSVVDSVSVATTPDSGKNVTLGAPSATNAPVVDGGTSPSTTASSSPNTTSPTSSTSSNGGGVGSPEYEQFVTQAENHRKTLANQAKIKKETIGKGAKQEKQGISRQVEVEATRLKAAYDNAIAQVNTAIANAKTDIKLNKEAKIAKVKATAQSELDNVNKVGKDKQAEVKRVAEQKAQDIEAFGESEAKRALDGCKVRVDKANTLKNSKIAEVQGKANGAQLGGEIEKEAAKVIADLNKSGGDLAEMARSRAKDAAKNFRKEGEEAAGKFTEPTEKAGTAVIGARDETIKAIQNAASDSLSELQSDATIVVKNLQTEKAEKLAQVSANADSIAAGVDSATEEANAKIDAKTSEVDSEAVRFQDKIAEVKWAGNEIESAALDLQIAIDQHNAEMDTLVTNVIAAFGQGIKDAIANLGDAITKQITEITKVSTEFETKASTASTKVVNAMEEQRTQGDEEMKKPAAELDKQFQLAIQRASEGWDRNFTEARDDISHAVNDGLRKQDDAIAEFDTALSGIASKAGSWLSSTVEAIKDVGSFLAGVVVGAFWHVIDFFVALWDLIKKPLFWIVVVIVAIILIAAIIYFGWAAVAGALAAIGKVLLVIGIIIGIGIAIYYIYIAITKPDLSPYERGKYVGKAVVEVLLAFIGTGVWARLTGWLARVARIAKVLDMVGDLLKASRLLRRVPDVETVIKLLEKVKDADKLLELLDKVKDAEEALKLLEKSTDIVSLLKLLELAKSSEKVLQLLEKVKDASKAVELLEKVKNIDTLLSILGKTTDVENLLKLLEAVKDADKVLLLLEKSTDIKNLLQLVDEIKNVEKLIALLDEIKDAKKLLELYGKVKDADLLLALAKKVKDTPKLEALLEKVTDAAQLERLLNAVDNVADLEKLLKEMSPAEIEQFINDLKDANKFKLIANKYVGQALKHYGPQFFRDYKGVDSDAINHLLTVSVSQTKGITGCHDEAMFLAEMAKQPTGVIAPPGSGLGPVGRPTVNSADPAVKKFTYQMWQQDGKGSLVNPLTPKATQLEKTTINGLASNPAPWQASANQAADQAINTLAFPTGDGSFVGVANNGLGWTGWFRNKIIQTVFVNF